jgi:cyclic pyranopterin phosphate synthase
MKELQEEREMLFGFTDEETNAWQLQGSSIDSAHVEAINQIRTQGLSKDAEDTFSRPFTHLSDDGLDISMVDVGKKPVTQRVARAQSRVIFPPEIVSAFQMVGNDLVGPKGPIFSTARTAGIMAAKKTSDLIPLCHPLPLDKVMVEIRLQDNVATIECECRVTHKTGVEMEALTGASIAALTIYDMVKAVSHRVQITDTVLLSKSGGRRNIESSP